MKLHDVPDGFRMTPGMPVTADIKVGKRTVLAYLMARVLPVASRACASRDRHGWPATQRALADRAVSAWQADRHRRCAVRSRPPGCGGRGSLIEGRRARAFPLLRPRRQAGIAEAEFLVARCYLEGAGVPLSAVEGVALAGAGRQPGLSSRRRRCWPRCMLHGIPACAPARARSAPDAASDCGDRPSGARQSAPPRRQRTRRRRRCSHRPTRRAGPRLRARREMGAPRRRGRLGRRPGAARPSSSPPAPRRCATSTRPRQLVSRGRPSRLPAGLPRLCPGAAAQPARRTRATTAKPRAAMLRRAPMRAWPPRSICSA